MLQIPDPEVKKRFLDHRTRLGAVVCLVTAIMALSLVNFTVSADKGGHRSAGVADSCVPGGSGCPVSDLVPGSARRFYPGSWNLYNDDGTPCSVTDPCRYRGPRTPGAADTDIVRFRDGLPLTSNTCGAGGVVPTMAILALRPRVNGTAQMRVNANGQSTAPNAPFNDGTYEWYRMQVCIRDTPDHPGVVTTWLNVSTCSTVDDAAPTSNDNNISTLTVNPDVQPGACQSAPLVDYIVNYSMSYNESSMTPCWDTSFSPNPEGFKTLTLTRIGKSSPNLGLLTNIPTAPVIATGTLTTCTGAMIEVTPWDGDLFDGLEFKKWHGACSGTGPCTVTMTEDTSVTAKFTN